MARAAWIYRGGAGVGKGKLTLCETRSFLKDQGAQRFEEEGAAPFRGWMDGFMWYKWPYRLADRVTDGLWASAER